MLASGSRDKTVKLWDSMVGVGEGRRTGVIEGEAGYPRWVMAEAPCLIRMLRAARSLISLEAAGVPDFLASPGWKGSEVLAIQSSLNWRLYLGKGV